MGHAGTATLTFHPHSPKHHESTIKEKEREFARLSPAERSGKEPPAKHRFPKGFHRGQELFGQHAARLREPGYREFIAQHGLVIVEGFNDVIGLDNLGVPALGIMSNRITEAQGEKIARWARQISSGRVTLMLNEERVPAKVVSPGVAAAGPRRVVPGSIAFAAFPSRIVGRASHACSLSPTAMGGDRSAISRRTLATFASPAPACRRLFFPELISSVRIAPAVRPTIRRPVPSTDLAADKYRCISFPVLVGRNAIPSWTV